MYTYGSVPLIWNFRKTGEKSFGCLQIVWDPAGQSWPEPARAEPNQTGLSQTEQDRTEPNRAEPGRANRDGIWAGPNLIRAKQS